jgi:hypothetical protein
VTAPLLLVGVLTNAKTEVEPFGFVDSENVTEASIAANNCPKDSSNAAIDVLGNKVALTVSSVRGERVGTGVAARVEAVGAADAPSVVTIPLEFGAVV